MKLKRFCKAVVETLGSTNLRSTTEADVKKILKESARRGTPGLLGRIDCCKRAWKNCPAELHGQFKGKEKTQLSRWRLSVTDHSAFGTRFSGCLGF